MGNSLVYNFLSEQDPALAKKFKKTTNPSPLPDGSPSLGEIARFYHQTSPLGKRKSEGAVDESSKAKKKKEAMIDNQKDDEVKLTEKVKKKKSKKSSNKDGSENKEIASKTASNAISNDEKLEMKNNESDGKSKRDKKKSKKKESKKSFLWKQRSQKNPRRKNDL